jgi:hypothetical protein
MFSQTKVVNSSSIATNSIAIYLVVALPENS